MESIRINTHTRIAKLLNEDNTWRNKPLCNILHKLDEAIGFPIKPLLPSDKDHSFWTHPDRNLEDMGLIGKYEIKLFECLVKTFDKVDWTK